MSDNGKKYKVLKAGLSQNIDGVRTKPAAGSFIALTDAAAAHLIGEGLVEEVVQKAPPKSGKGAAK